MKAVGAPMWRCRNCDFRFLKIGSWAVGSVVVRWVEIGALVALAGLAVVLPLRH